MALTQQDVQAWVEARKRHRLNHKQVHNHKQERWKAPLPEFIEDLYFKRFRKEQPDDVRPIEQRFAALQTAKRREKAPAAPEGDVTPEPS